MIGSTWKLEDALLASEDSTKLNTSFIEGESDDPPRLLVPCAQNDRAREGDPSLFPLQPTEPIIPLIVIALGAYVLLRGAGAWSLDLRATPPKP